MIKPLQAQAYQKPPFCNKSALPPESLARLGERRKATIAAFGILKGTGVFPEDGLVYQLEVRSEWDDEP